MPLGHNSNSFPDEQLNVINASRSTPWYADYANYIVAKYIPPSFTYQQKKKLFFDLRHYFWDDPHLYKEGVDGFIRFCFNYMREHVPSQATRIIQRRIPPYYTTSQPF